MPPPPSVPSIPLISLRASNNGGEEGWGGSENEVSLSGREKVEEVVVHPSILAYYLLPTSSPTPFRSPGPPASSSPTFPPEMRL